MRLPRLVKLLLQWLLLPLFIYFGWIAYAYSVDLFSALMPLAEIDRFSREQGFQTPTRVTLITLGALAAGFLAAVCNAFIFSRLLLKVYGRMAVPIAATMLLPLIAIQVPEWQSWRFRLISSLIVAVELAMYAALLIGGTWILLKRRVAKSKSSESGAPQ